MPSEMMSFILKLIFLLFHISDSTSRENIIEDIVIRFYNGKTVKESVVFPLANITRLLETTEFKKQNKTVLFIHGYEESAGSASVKSVVSAFRTFRDDVNVVLLDWGNMATGSYMNNAATNTDKVGRAAGYYVLQLLAEVDSKRLHIIADSLGCHVAASLGRTTMISGVTIGRITGLDCAYVMYFPAIAGRRLSNTVAEFVDVIHTDSRMQGMPLSMGHVDFWPNGGKRRQPGCPQNNIFKSLNAATLKAEFCSHDRAWIFYAESIKTPRAFKAVKCSSYDDFRANKCANKPKTYMGFGVSLTARGGDYYLRTNNKAPFGLQERGIKIK